MAQIYLGGDGNDRDNGDDGRDAKYCVSTLSQPVTSLHFNTSSRSDTFPQPVAFPYSNMSLRPVTFTRFYIHELWMPNLAIVDQIYLEGLG